MTQSSDETGRADGSWQSGGGSPSPAEHQGGCGRSGYTRLAHSGCLWKAGTSESALGDRQSPFPVKWGHHDLPLGATGD